MVTAMHPLAAELAAELLASGGSAFDAAVAALAMLSVAEPFMSGLGGHGAALVAQPGRDPYVIDGSALGPQRNLSGEPPVRGAAAVPVPMALTAWLGLHQAGPRRELAELFAPAIARARDGVPAAWYTALMISANSGLLRQDDAAARIFLDESQLPPRPSISGSDPEGLLKNPDLAHTLERLAVGGLEELRQGETGARLVAAVASGGGSLTAADLEHLSVAQEQPPLSGSFLDWEVHSGPVASAGASLLEMLRLLEWLDPVEVPLGSTAYYEAHADAQRAAFLDREQHGDPAFVATPLGAYSDPELARLRREDLATAGSAALPIRDLHRPGYPVVSGGRDRGDDHAGSGPDGTSTTHLNVAAPDGTLISATFTLGYPFGSGVVVPGTGLLLGNTLHQFSNQPGHPNCYAAGKRAVWNGAPTILSRGGKPRIAVGAPGGPRIPGAIAQVLVARLIYDLSPQRAIEVPRIFQQGDITYLDDRVPTRIVEELRGRGRQVRTVREGPFASAFGRPGMIDLGDGSIEGGVDPWRLGTIAGW